MKRNVLAGFSIPSRATQHMTIDEIVKPEILYALHPRYPDTQ